MGKTCERQGKLLGNDRKLDENGENEESLMTINAIDGTVIDKQLGY